MTGSIVLARTGWLAEVLARQLQGCSLADALDSAPCKYMKQVLEGSDGEYRIVLARTGWLAEVLARQLQGCSLADALDSAPCKYNKVLNIFHHIFTPV